ncbi:MAG: DNA topoisomerase IV subunit A [Candidatus Thorarchaeota archaeon]|nr:DNA topoisomerase IV subunit A [Candidatus Thorarchaeota archaeon]
MSKESTVKTLTSIGRDVMDAILEGEFPSLHFPDRSTDNIVYDGVTNQFVLGDSSTTRDSSNLRHVRSFAQLIWVAYFAKKLTSAQRTSSLRDLYYSSEAYGVKFSNQAESDRIVTDLETLTGLARENFGIFPEERSSIFGDVRMRYTVSGYENQEVCLTASPDGFPIGRALMTAKPVDASAEIILAIESGGMFSRLIETGAWKRYQAVLIHLGGQPPRATRSLMRRLREELELPIFIFTDGDPWGMHIARVIIGGSANSAHLRGLAVPDAEWIGVTPSDIVNHSLPTEPMNNADLKRLDELLHDVRYAGPVWQDYIKAFRELRSKAEQQAFSRHGMDYVVDTYLKEKLP